MNFLISWKQSLSLFYPSNFRIFVMSCIHLFITGYKLLFQYKRITLLVMALITLLMLSSAIPECPDLYLLATGITPLFLIFPYLFYIFSIAIKSSITKKNKDYFMRYLSCKWKLFVYFFLIPNANGLLALLLAIITIPLMALFSLFLPEALISQSCLLILMVFFTVFWPLSSLFFILFFNDKVGANELDSWGPFIYFFRRFYRIWKNSLKIILYNLPALIIVFIIYFIAMLLLLSLPILFYFYVIQIRFIVIITHLFLAFFVPASVASIMTVLFTKFVYEQVPLYVKGPQ